MPKKGSPIYHNPFHSNNGVSVCSVCVWVNTRFIGSDVEGGRERGSSVRYGGDAAVVGDSREESRQCG